MFVVVVKTALNPMASTVGVVLKMRHTPIFSARQECGWNCWSVVVGGGGGGVVVDVVVVVVVVRSGYVVLLQQ